jgi:hypothetical protein
MLSIPEHGLEAGLCSIESRLEKFEEPADMEALGQIIGIINRDEHTDE